MSKAFDKVRHEGVVFKLEQNGVTGNLLKLFGNYLSDIENKRSYLTGRTLIGDQ